MPPGQIIIFIVIGLMAAFGVYAGVKHLRRKRGGKTDTGQDAGQDESFNPVLADVNYVDRRFYRTEMVGADIVKKIFDEYRTLGGQWDFDGKMVYSFRKVGQHYEPTENIFDMSRDHNPTDIHDAIYQPEIAITHNLKQGRNLLQEYGWLIPWTVAIAFLIFMTVAS